MINETLIQKSTGYPTVQNRSQLRQTKRAGVPNNKGAELCFLALWTVCFILELMYLLMVAIVFTIPLLILAELFDEKPTQTEILSAEDHVLDNGGAFADCKKVLIV